MKDNTPYRERPQREITREQQCMRVIFARAQPVDFIFEAFGGLGMTAQVMSEQFPVAKILASDLDADCVEIYNKELSWAHADCIQSDALALFKTIRNFPNRWGASLDFNRFTIMDVFGRKESQWKVDLIEAVVERQPTWIQLTDSAVRYLHLNAKRYGCNPDPVDYIHTLSQSLYERWGLNYVIHSGFYAASYILLTPTRF